jgi:hypothetical protein
MLPGELFLSVAIGLVIGLIVLLVLQLIASARMRGLTDPVFEYARMKARAEADRILNEAQEKARTIVAETAMRGAELLEEQRADVGKRTDIYQKNLEAFTEHTHAAMEENAKKARAEQIKIAEAIAKEMQAQGEEIKARVSHIEKDLSSFLHDAEAQTRDIRATFEDQSKRAGADMKELLEKATTEGKKRIDERIELFLTEARKEVDAYREGRKRIIDEHMADLVAETSKVVLGKALTPDDHADLVTRALEEAKRTGML